MVCGAECRLWSRLPGRLAGGHSCNALCTWQGRRGKCGLSQACQADCSPHGPLFPACSTYTSPRECWPLPLCCGAGPGRHLCSPCLTAPLGLLDGPGKFALGTEPCPQKLPWPPGLAPSSMSLCESLAVWFCAPPTPPFPVANLSLSQRQRNAWNGWKLETQRIL